MEFNQIYVTLTDDLIWMPETELYDICLKAYCNPDYLKFDDKFKCNIRIKNYDAKGCGAGLQDKRDFLRHVVTHSG